MNAQAIVAIVLALAALVAGVRVLLAARRDPRRPRAWRTLALVLLQPLLAGTLYLTLFPPPQPVRAGVMTVLTEGAAPPSQSAGAQGDVVLALPEAPRVAGVERVPDLGTALRRHPGTTHIRVLGAGLVARDRDAAERVAVEYVAPEPPRGLVRLDTPRRPGQGDAVAIAGNVAGVGGGRVELLDPAGRRIDVVSLDDEGGFSLQALAFAAGPAAFRLRIRDGEGAQVDEVDLPLWIEEAPAPRVLLLAGAPNPETRQLRRWIEDAGLPLQARVSLGGGMRLGDAAPTTEVLARTDLLIADARAWTDLGDGGRARVLDAVRAGMGLLVRADTPLPAGALRALRGEGFAIEGGTALQPWQPAMPRLRDEAALRARSGAGSEDAPFDPALADAAVPALSRRAWRISGPGAIALVAGDATHGAWRAEGEGRIGLWTPVDTFQLALHGRRDLYADLWQPVIAELSRARRSAPPDIASDARAGERTAICGLAGDAVVESPDGRAHPLLVDPATGHRRCAAFWPESAGWHRLLAGDAVHPFHVAAADAMPALRLAQLHESTRALAARSPAQADAGEARRPGPSWPWFLGWLLLAGVAWWLERARVGFAAAAVQHDAAPGMR
ncbi:carboxypeptidase regulatory-like domain-containing protein [Luteimonas marina]|uniref:Carboxypeptidase regulatory-like domain-containing protein n=1 Tax=Luteimonas marina TaxID=488485 RepID=A0A5C5TVM9_9GAMM|nr:carboxypeptidase regulatory-like domain-containing protein [Luteimonas marina]TWT17824.1 carboxypeptidase regulatory-like domain-containing protein [Luteimonas marina]